MSVFSPPKAGECRRYFRNKGVGGVSQGLKEGGLTPWSAPARPVRQVTCACPDRTISKPVGLQEVEWCTEFT